MKSTTILIFVLLAWMLSTVIIIAQNVQTGYFTDGFLYRHRMNPAIANEKNYASLALGNINFSFRGNLALKNVFYQVDGKTATFMHPDLSSSEVLSKFKDKNQLGLNANLELLSAGFKAFKGYNTIGVNVRSNSHITLPGELFRLAKEGIANQTYDISNFNTHADAYIEVALGHSHQINEKLHIGGTLKVLLGGGNVDAQFNKAQLVLGEDQWTVTSDAYVEASIKDLTYETDLNEDTNHRYVSGADVVDGAGINGSGFAVDLGAVYQHNNDWSFSASVIDLGIINWKNNMLASTNGEKTFSTDEYIFNVDDDQANNFDDELKRLENGLSALYELSDMGDQGSVMKGIGTTIHLGASYNIPEYRKLTIGLLNTSHLQKNFTWTDLRASANWVPYNFLSASISAAYGTFGGSIGWMLNLHPKGFNLFLAMDQITGSLSKQYIPLSGVGTFHFGMNIPF
ncbi:MAG: DUF5723 family protein [Dysgonamonadaceae bacterium]|nr:DUF5723 family protein [Dysgonamonadaceae bacterium]MDD4728409.1 DUF5723 family protein [Dysgonamonadaceae bacterium]